MRKNSASVTICWISSHSKWQKPRENQQNTKKTADPMRHLLKAFRHGSAVFLFSQGFGNLCPTLSKTSRKPKNTTSERNWERALNREYVLYKMPLLTFTRIQLWMRNQKEIDSWKDCWNSRSKWFLWKRSIHSGNGKTYRIQYQYPS